MIQISSTDTRTDSLHNTLSRYARMSADQCEALLARTRLIPHEDWPHTPYLILDLTGGTVSAWIDWCHNDWRPGHAYQRGYRVALPLYGDEFSRLREDWGGGAWSLIDPDAVDLLVERINDQSSGLHATLLQAAEVVCRWEMHDDRSLGDWEQDGETGYHVVDGDLLAERTTWRRAVVDTARRLYGSNVVRGHDVPGQWSVRTWLQDLEAEELEPFFADQHVGYTPEYGEFLQLAELFCLQAAEECVDIGTLQHVAYFLQDLYTRWLDRERVAQTLHDYRVFSD